MSFLDLQDLARVAAQEDFWRLIAGWCSECDVLEILGLALAAAGVALMLKRRKVEL
jgi:hypothetical protein